MIPFAILNHDAPEPSREQVKVGRFTYMYSDREWVAKSSGDWLASWDRRPDSGHYKERWLVHDESEFCAAVYESRGAAVAACERWTKADAHLLVVAWESAPEEADDSHRGTYIVSLDGCRRQRTFCCGWHTMEHQIAFTEKVRDLIAELGIEAVRKLWNALL